MIQITKQEKELIAEQFPYISTVRTMRQKSKRHHYYIEEHPKVMRFLNKLRSNNTYRLGEEPGSGT